MTSSYCFLQVLKNLPPEPHQTLHSCVRCKSWTLRKFHLQIFSFLFIYIWFLFFLVFLMDDPLRKRITQLVRALSVHRLPSSLQLQPSIILSPVYFRSVDRSSRYDGSISQTLNSVFNKLLPEKGRTIVEVQ